MEKVNNLEEKVERYENGEIKSICQMENGLKNGVERHYDKNGFLWLETHFKDGKKNGVETTFYFRNKGVYSSQSFVDGIANGDLIHYYDSGAVKTITPYLNGVANGNQQWFYEDGALMGEISYKNGLRDGEAIWFSENGDTKNTHQYRNGSRVA